MKIRAKNRKWIIHYYHLGKDAANFGVNYMKGIGDTWPISKTGVSGVQAFSIFESTGKKEPTRNPKMINILTAGKKLHGVTVDLWAQERADGMLSLMELKEYCNEIPGLLEEVERKKVELWPIKG